MKQQFGLRLSKQILELNYMYIQLICQILGIKCNDFILRKHLLSYSLHFDKSARTYYFNLNHFVNYSLDLYTPTRIFAQNL